MREPQKVSLARIVLYRPRGVEEAAAGGGNSAMGDQVLPATVVKVWSDTCVNLKVHADGPNDIWATSAQLAADAEKPEDLPPGHWMWPPRG